MSLYKNRQNAVKPASTQLCLVLDTKHFNFLILILLYYTTESCSGLLDPEIELYLNNTKRFLLFSYCNILPLFQVMCVMKRRWNQMQFRLRKGEHRRMCSTAVTLMDSSQIPRTGFRNSGSWTKNCHSQYEETKV